jgi:hypothetical protein
MALKADGTVWIWGWNPSGELGIGVQDFIPYPTPMKVPGLANVVRIMAGDSLSYAIKSDGSVWGWGSNVVGRVGDGTTGGVKTSPVELPALRDTLALGSGIASTMVMKQGGSVWSFGLNLLGGLGRGIPDTDTYPVPTQIPNLTAKAISSGYSHHIVTLTDGTVRVFGGNEVGQLGLGTADNSAHPSPVSVPGLSGVFATAAGGSASFALIGNPTTGGTIRAWGGNSFGVLGIGTIFPSHKPAVVAESLTVAKPIFSVPEGTTVATQVHVACGTPGAVIHYTTNGAEPTESDPVIASGSSIAVSQSLTLKAKAFKQGFTASAVKSATYTITAAPSLQLVLDDTGPALDQLAALDSLSFLRDPFPVLNLNDFLNLGSDSNTRVILFAANLQLAPGEAASSVTVNVVDSNSQTFDIPAEDVRPLANTPYVQVIFRLPNNLAIGTCRVRIKFHSQTSNQGTIRIKS